MFHCLANVEMSNKERSCL